MLRGTSLSDRWPPMALTPREVDVIEMAARGLTNGQVARQLNISIHAVKFHLSAIYRKLGVANRTEAAVYYLRASSVRDGDPQ